MGLGSFSETVAVFCNTGEFLAVTRDQFEESGHLKEDEMIYSFDPCVVRLRSGVGLAGLETVVAGEEIDAGKFVYIDPMKNLARLAVCTDQTASGCCGIALNSAKIGQPVSMVKRGHVTVGSMFFTSGIVLVLSSTPGCATEASSSLSGYLTILGFSVRSDELELCIVPSKVKIQSGEVL